MAGPLAIIFVVLCVVGGYLTWAERRLAELYERGDERALATATRPVELVALGCFPLGS